MKILLVNTYHFRGGGDSTYTFNLADLLRSKGHEVAFFAMQDARNFPDPNSDLFVSHVDFRELNRNKSLVTGLKTVGRVIYSREAQRKFRELLNRFKPDLVHLQNIHAHISPSVIFEAKKHDLPVFWTLHDYKLICPNTHYYMDHTGELCEACGRGLYYLAILKRCKKGSLLASGVAALEAYAHWLLQVRDRVDAFLAPSLFLRNKLIDRGFPPEKVQHLPYLLPPEMFNECSENQGYLLFLGKIEPIKGIRPLLAACRLVPEVKLILAGRVEESFASELPTLLPPNAHYAGMKQGEELRQLLHDATAVVVPSLWYENQPFSILEAFAAGKPVIASDLGGMSELVGDGDRGFLVAPGDVESLARIMARVSKCPPELREMGAAAKEYALREHGAERHYQALLRIYGHERRTE